MKNAIGLIELCSIAKGFEVADGLIKVAKSELIEAHSVCPGKSLQDCRNCKAKPIHSRAKRGRRAHYSREQRERGA